MALLDPSLSWFRPEEEANLGREAWQPLLKDIKKLASQITLGYDFKFQYQAAADSPKSKSRFPFVAANPDNTLSINIPQNLWKLEDQEELDTILHQVILQALAEQSLNFSLGDIRAWSKAAQSVQLANSSYLNNNSSFDNTLVDRLLDQAWSLLQLQAEDSSKFSSLISSAFTQSEGIADRLKDLQDILRSGKRLDVNYEVVANDTLQGHIADRSLHRSLS